MKRITCSLFIAVMFLLNPVYAQTEMDESAMIHDFQGIQHKAADSSYYINFRFRMQNRLGAYTRSGEDLRFDEYDARVRRLRMRVDGYLLNPKLAYSIQLAFSRGDQDFDDTGMANIVRDAVVFYHFSPKFYMALGLNKLPGNRQRVNSSGQLQFVDRSIVNSAFTTDRDYGVKAYYKNNLGQLQYQLKGAISTGEGRSALGTDDGLAYTGRVELLPLGEFSSGGDYSEGDLEREATPKLSLGGGFSLNKKAKRTGGQLGEALYSQIDMETWFFDALIKYNGWAYSAEFMKRSALDPFTYNPDGEMRYAMIGQGLNQQLSYVFRNNFELAFRYSWLSPNSKIRAEEDKISILELGASKYLRGHRIKVQLNANYEAINNEFALNNDPNRWGLLGQIEFGI